MMIAALSMGTLGVQAAKVQAPAIKTVSNTAGGVKITWEKSPSAKGYYIYRGTKSTNLQQIAKVKSSKKSYTDKTAKEGKVYYYEVVSYSGSKTGRSEAVKIRRLTKPTVQAAVTSDTVTLSWAESSKATGYKIYRKQGGGSYAKIATVKKASSTTWTDEDVETGTKYTYKVVAYKGSFKSAGATVSATPVRSVIEGLSPSRYSAISADVTLASTSGTGSHAKLVIGTGTAAVSFGLQYDSAASAPYTRKTALLIENITSGDQKYTRYDYNGSSFASLDTTYSLTLTVKKSTGKVTAYVNNTKVGSVTNSELKNQTLYCWVEGSARKNGDKIDATFTNLSVVDNKYEASETPVVSFTQKAGGIKLTNQNGKTIKKDTAPRTIHIKGTLSGLSSSLDWDSAPSSVNGYVRFY